MANGLITVRVLTCCRKAIREKFARPKNVKNYVQNTIQSLKSSDASGCFELAAVRVPGESQDWLDQCEDVPRVDIPWRGIYESYRDAASHPSDTDWLLLLEDDVLVDVEIVKKSEAFICAIPEMVLGTIFDHQPYGPRIPAKAFWGSQAMLIHKSVVEKLPYSFDDFEGMEGMTFPYHDLILASASQAEFVYCHQPSLVEHIGDESTLVVRRDPIKSNQFQTKTYG